MGYCGIHNMADCSWCCLEPKPAPPEVPATAYERYEDPVTGELLYRPRSTPEVPAPEVVFVLVKEDGMPSADIAFTQRVHAEEMARITIDGPLTVVRYVRAREGGR